MDGVLLIDKPAGPTSHDIVGWARRLLGQRDIGHTGTLDPLATGLLVLVLGRATRLSSLLTGKDKTYEAEIRLGFATETDDAEGAARGAVSATLPGDEAIRAALAGFDGAFEQRPPAHSAKSIGGRRSYDLARRRTPVVIPPVTVTLRSAEWLGRHGDRCQVRVTVSAGFYVRALARDLGERLGCGGHLSALRRTASGSFAIADAVSLEVAEAQRDRLGSRVIACADALPDVPSVRLTEAGLRRARHGNPIGSPDVLDSPLESGALVKILGPDRRLLALAEWRGASLHPRAVLG